MCRYTGSETYHGEKHAAGDDCSSACYYDDVWPLANLQAKCTKQGRIAKLESACWNKEYKPAPGLVVLVVTASLSGDCPSQAAADEAKDVVACTVEDALEYADIKTKIKGATVSCTVSRGGVMCWLHQQLHAMYACKPVLLQCG